MSSKYEWNLKEIFENKKEFDNLKKDLEDELEEISKYQGKLCESSDNLYSCYKLYEKALEKYEKLYGYGMLYYNLDMSNQEGIKLYKEVESLGTKFGTKTSFIEPEITYSKDGVVEKYLEEDKRLLRYKREILDILKEKEHILSKQEENLLANYSEVFSSPDRMRVNGRVYSSKPLLHNSNMIEDFWLEFKDGKIVDYDAKKGKEILKGIIETDEGSHYLGEVALVDYTSPISLTNILFKNTLYDENASCHLAIGEGFPECIEGGFDKSKEELLALGLNMSHEHVDFFIGTSDLEIKAVLQNGRETVIMKDGNFVEV